MKLSNKEKALKSEIKELKNLLKNKSPLSETCGNVSVVVQVPERLYLNLKECAENDIRTVPNEILYLVNKGFQQLADEYEKEQALETELEPQIGFQIERQEEEYEDDEEDKKAIKRNNKNDTIKK